MPVRPSRPLTAARLEAAALHYLERFATSSGHLRQVLLRRVERSVRQHGTDRQEGVALVETLIGRFLSNGLLDNDAYAQARTAGLHRRGKSARGIAAALAARQVEPELIRAVLDAQDEHRPGGDLAAAAALARRRRLGPFRPPALREALRARDLAAFARAGFARRVAETVLACADPEAVAALLVTES